jgi:hypothetical protein
MPETKSDKYIGGTTMDNSDKQFEADLKQHFERQGSYDPQKGQTMVPTVTDQYRRALCKIERYLWIHLYVIVIVLEFCVYRFMGTQDTKALIAYGVLFLLAIEISVLIKLWYWVMNTKIRILRDLKLLRAEAVERNDRREILEDFGIKGLQGCSKRESRLWQIGLLVLLGIIMVFFVKYPHFQWSFAPGPETIGAEYTSVLDADGREAMDFRLSVPNLNLFPMETFSYYSGACCPEQVVQDFAGHRLSATSRPAGSNLYWTIKLAEPVLPGHRLFLKSHTWNLSTAKNENGIWTYHNTIAWGPVARYRYKLSLPVKAEVIATEPRPVSRTAENGRPVLSFEDTYDNGRLFEVTVKYRLSEK